MFSERQEPWSFGPAIEEIARKFIRLRYRLLPVFYALFDEHRQTGLPLLRPLVLHYPSDVQVHGMEDQCLLGRNVLVAPVLKQGHEARAVYLPEGRWYDFWTGEAHEGGREIFVKATLDTMPLFVRAGTTLPLAPPMQYVGERAWDEVELRLFPGEGTSQFYEDDGTSHAYEDGDVRRTTFTLRAPAPGACTLLREHEGDFASPVKRFTIRLMDVGEPEEVRLDEQVIAVTTDVQGENAESVYDAESRTLTVRAAPDFRRFDVSGIG